MSCGEARELAQRRFALSIPTPLVNDQIRKPNATMRPQSVVGKLPTHKKTDERWPADIQEIRGFLCRQLRMI
jgi:hypothetical protein